MTARHAQALGVLDQLQRGLRGLEDGLRDAREAERAAALAATGAGRRAHQDRLAMLTGQVEGVVAAELAVVQVAAELRASSTAA